MILKNKDPRTADIAELNRLLALPLEQRQRSLVQQELRVLQAGEKNEENAAYFLDFHLKDSQNWVVIHDLRIEHRGKVAQIDHLVINRFLYTFVLESKSYCFGVKITPEGEFLRWDGKAYRGIESPVEQNNRHIFALEQSIKDRALAPTRLGMTIPISFQNVVLISPKARIDRAGTDNAASVIKADAFWTHAQKEVDKISIFEVGKIVSSETLKEFGERLIKLHRPAGGMNYMAKFGISEDLARSPAPKNIVSSPPQSSCEPASAVTAEPRCDECAVVVESKVVAFCRFNKSKFNGKTLCRECQQKVGGNVESKDAEERIQSTFDAASPPVPTCPACNATMVKRQAKKGPNAGGWFWACTEFPKCRKVLPLDAYSGESGQ